jgi:hypothetical protein
MKALTQKQWKKTSPSQAKTLSGKKKKLLLLLLLLLYVQLGKNIIIDAMLLLKDALRFLKVPT